MAVLSGALTLPTYTTTPEIYEKVRWVCRGYSYVDPQKEHDYVIKAAQGKVFIYHENEIAEPEPEPIKTFNLYGEYE